MPSVKPDELTAKINSSHISSETKEILKLIMTMISTIQLDWHNRNKDLDKKVTSIQSTTTALEKEISDVKESTDHQMSIVRNEISSPKTKLIASEYKLYAWYGLACS